MAPLFNCLTCRTEASFFSLCSAFVAQVMPSEREVAIFWHISRNKGVDETAQRGGIGGAPELQQQLGLLLLNCHLWAISMKIITNPHKVLTYIEYRAVSGVFRTIDPPPPIHPASVSFPRHTRRAVREGLDWPLTV